MKTTRYFLAALLGTLASCHHSGDDVTPSLVGNWRLTNLQCYCPAGQPLPDQVITFDASQHFQLYRSGQLAAEGTYAFSQGSACGGGSGSQPLLNLAPTNSKAFAPSGAYTLQGNTLVIDQCLAADGPRYTFQRLP